VKAKIVQDCQQKRKRRKNWLRAVEEAYQNGSENPTRPKVCSGCRPREKKRRIWPVDLPPARKNKFGDAAHEKTPGKAKSWLSGGDNEQK